MNANRVRYRHMRRLIPFSIACCLGTFCSQPASEVSFKPALQVQRADARWPRTAAVDHMPLAAR